MAYRVMMSGPAADDREGIVAYLASTLSAPSAAAEFLDEFDKAVAMLSGNPRAGAVCSDTALAERGYRKALVGSYVAVYRVNDESQAVEIVRVFHQTQDYARLL